MTIRAKRSAKSIQIEALIGRDRELLSWDFHVSCPGWTRYTPESRRAHGLFFIAQSSRF